MAPPESSANPLGTALRVLGAVTGIAAVMTFVGGAMVWIRFDELRLPADQAVSLLPKQLLLIVGAHAMAVPVGVGVFVAVIFVLINAMDPRGEWTGLRKTMMWVFAIPSALVAAWLVRPYDVWPEWFVTAGTLVVGLVLLGITLKADVPHAILPWVVLGVWTLCGAVVAVMRTTGPPTMEPVAVVLDGTPSGVGGFYIGQTTDRLYIAPLPGSGDPGDPFADADINRVLEIDRAKIQQMSLRGPTGLRADEVGREQAQSLLEDLRGLISGKPAPDPRPIITSDPVTAFAPLVHLHADEKLMPMSAEAFLKNSWLAWAHDDGCDDWVPGDRHLARPSDDKAAKGAFDHSGLAGAGAYQHGLTDSNCDEVGRVGYLAAFHTRPFDAPDRTAGLPEKEGFYLDLDDKFRKGTAKVEKEGPQRVVRSMPVYWERASEKVDGQDGLRITYWTFYGLSQPPGNTTGTRYLVHEGDWERISVLIQNGQAEGEYLPISVRYHAHDGSRVVPWAAVKRVGTGGSIDSTHPVVYSARGSHASYWRAGDYENVFEFAGRRRFAVFDQATSCPDCPQWRTWETLLDAKAQHWYGYGGAWGNVGSDTGFTGPLGPSSYKSRGESTQTAEPVRRAIAPVAQQPGTTPTATP